MPVCRRPSNLGRPNLLPRRASCPPPREGEAPAEPRDPPLWEGEAPAEPRDCPFVRARLLPSRATRPFVRARLLPSRATLPRREDPAEPMDQAVLQVFGSAGASPSQGVIKWSCRCSAQRELRPPEGLRLTNIRQVTAISPRAPTQTGDASAGLSRESEHRDQPTDAALQGPPPCRLPADNSPARQ